MADTADSAGLGALRQRYGAALDAEIEGWIERVGYPRQFPGMLRYQMGYVDEKLRAASHPGKRVRPFLCLAVCEALCGACTAALPVAAGIEMLHNFSLVHDDIEDRDPSRHHRPTVWRVWGEAQAINAGDAMFAVAARAVADYDAGDAGSLVTQQFQETALALTKGQYLDMSFERRQEVSTDEYLQMITLKSAALLAFSTWAGAVVGGGSDRQQGLLFDFGDNLGRAFQIHDDVNGIWGDEESTGKQGRSDLERRKKTFPVVTAMGEASGPDHDRLRRFYAGDTDEVRAVVEVLERVGARETSQRALHHYLQLALQSLSEASLPPPFDQQLKAVAEEYTGQRDAVS